MKILIDNGHGIETPGKRSPLFNGLQLFEYEFNRDMANRIYRILLKNQVDCELLTPQINDIPLHERIKRANAWHNECECFLVSIHANAGGGKGSGWEIYTSPGQTRSDHYASIFFNEAKMWLPEFRMRTDMSDGDTDKEAAFAIITKTSCPAVLTENLFMDNEADFQFLMSEEGREIISYIHVNAILKILKSKS